MQKVFAVILFLISAVFSIKAVNVTAADSLEISYDCIYAVDWNVDINPVANICTFPQESVDKVVDAMQSIQKKWDTAKLPWMNFSDSAKNA